MSARKRIRDFLVANVGRVVTTDEISAVAGIRDYQRRIRELRDEEGLNIQSYRDDIGLKPNEYRLTNAHPRPAIARRISSTLRNEILERNGFTCQICGSTGGDPDPTNEAKKLRLVIDHITAIEQGGSNTRDNLRVLCNLCNQGKSNLAPATESAKNLLARIRKCDRATQLEILIHLERKLRPTKAESGNNE